MTTESSSAVTIKPPLVFLSGRGPWASSSPSACLDALMTAAVFDQPVELILHGDGVFQLLANQNGDAIQMKTLARQFGALGLYGIDQIKLEESSVQSRGLNITDLLDTGDSEDPTTPLCLTLVSTTEIAESLRSAKQVFTF